MSRYLITLTLFCGIVFGLPACTTASDSENSEEALTVAELQAEADEMGEQEVLTTLWQDEARFNQVLDSIETGDSGWLAIAQQLRPFSDAGISTSLNYAVARALPNAPKRVLGLVEENGFSLEDVCDSPFIEPEPGVAEEYEARTLEALSTVEDSSLVSLVEACSERVRVPNGE